MNLVHQTGDRARTNDTRPFVAQSSQWRSFHTSRDPAFGRLLAGVARGFIAVYRGFSQCLAASRAAFQTRVPFSTFLSVALHGSLFRAGGVECHRL
jgi:hypothetical protein